MPDTSPHGNLDAPRLPVLGEPQGQCEACNGNQAQIHCYFCGSGGFCDSYCLELHRDEGKHVCIDRESTSADQLVKSVCTDEFPTDYDTLSNFYFCNCATMKDWQNLLRLYHCLHVQLNVSKFQLHQWMVAKEIYKNTVRIFNRNLERIPPHYLIWLKRHKSMFANEDTSEDVIVTQDAQARAILIGLV